MPRPTNLESEIRTRIESLAAELAGMVRQEAMAAMHRADVARVVRRAAARKLAHVAVPAVPGAAGARRPAVPLVAVGVRQTRRPKRSPRRCSLR
jgi:hypothetical protein